MRMLAEWVRAAKAGESVWLEDVREACRTAEDCESLILRLTLLDGTRRDYPCAVPRWESEEERRFVREYVCACVFNPLTALSGSELRFYWDGRCAQLTELLGELKDIFQLHQTPRRGYGKAISVANRLLAEKGELFAFAFEDMTNYRPLPEEKPAPRPKDLAARLRRAAGHAKDLVCCGIDVGGTDIKLAASVKGRLAWVREYDWDPARSATAEGLMEPILTLAREALQATGEAAFDAIGLSFPDIVIGDRILGGETPKTQGMRANQSLDYEREFRKLGTLRERLLSLCRPDGSVHLTNDGNMAAFCAAVELAHSVEANAVQSGVLAHSLGTDLGTGWLRADGTIPALPLEMYDLLLDLGSWPQRKLPADDLRAVCNENSGLPGVRRYLGQAAAYRLAYERDPALLDGFAEPSGELRMLRQFPQDMRKPCLEHLMTLADRGVPQAEAIFRQIGQHLAEVNLEMQFLLCPETEARYLFGRFVKHQRCFELLREGCARVSPALRLVAADETLACSPLMRALSKRGSGAVAQYGQAVAAIIYGLYYEEERI